MKRRGREEDGSQEQRAGCAAAGPVRRRRVERRARGGQAAREQPAAAAYEDLAAGTAQAGTAGRRDARVEGVVRRDPRGYALCITYNAKLKSVFYCTNFIE